MQSFNIVRNPKISNSFRVKKIVGMFDLSESNIERRFSGEFDVPKEWSVGIIVGASGTGKTTIAKELFPDAYTLGFEYKSDSILDDFPKDCSVDKIVSSLNSVGLSSAPSWVNPYSVLSNGEKMRCDIARAICEPSNFFVFDEFTSVVDRTVAQISSFAIQKAIRRSGKQFIAVSCHYDIIDWLEPDWVFDTNTMTFEVSKKKDQKLTYQYMKQNPVFGNHLKTITI